jgi:hypothetical protein
MPSTMQLYIHWANVIVPTAGKTEKPVLSTALGLAG